ncbi:MAG: hypothetical protein KA978_22720 [Deltaproteobacteria bacterium]|nr:hypothetical protein [Deltaproteobacteria bacterium]
MFSTGVGTFPSDWMAVLVALALLLTPVLLGVLATALARARLPRRWRTLWAALLLSTPVALSLLAIPRSNELSLWDFAFATGGFMVGVVLALIQPDGAVLAGARRTGGRVLVGLLVAEVIVRVALPSPGDVPPPRSARLLLPVTNREPPCNVTYPEANVQRQTLTEGAPGRPMVLHIGDSLVEGIGVPREETFVSLVGAAQPGVHHVNLGTVGAGPDVYFLALSRWAPLARARLAVVYLFVGNDMFDLEARYLCCAGGGLLRDESDHPAMRCPTPRWHIPLKAHLTTSPAPFTLRALAGVSRVAGHLLRFVIRVQQDAHRRGFGILPSPGAPGAMVPRWALLSRRIRAIAAAARDNHTPLLMVVLPSRPTLERTFGRTPRSNDYWGTRERGEEGHRRFLDAVRAEGIDALDAWDVIRSTMAQDGAERTFANEYPGDVHLGRLGHRRLAEWLLPHLQARGINP